MNSIITPTRLAIHTKKESPLYSETAIIVSLDDEGGGEFLTIGNSDSEHVVSLNFDEIDILADACHRLASESLLREKLNKEEQ